MRQDDFVEVMKEIVPNLIEQTVLSSERGPSTKRPVESPEGLADATCEPASSRPRTHEVLSVQDCSDLLGMADTVSSEVLMAEYLKKKMSKELKHSHNPPSLQRKVDEGKLVEWQTLLNKPNAIRLHFGKQAEYIRKHKADRFIGSRFVLTRKPLEEGREIDPTDESTFSVKGRWCLQGHLVSYSQSTW